ncbi:MAG: glycosyltransferase [Desulfatibacillum sp.]|nr:glycosyltransferase [Desulfatibacillum sp.]
MNNTNENSRILGLVTVPDSEDFSVWEEPVLELHICSPDKLEPDETLGSIRATREGERVLLDLSQAKTEWILLSRKKESLDPQGLQNALDLLAGAKKKPLLVTVKNRLSASILSRYEWAGTRDVYDNPGEFISTVITQEPRLIPRAAFQGKTLSVRISRMGQDVLLVDNLPQAIKLKLAPLTLVAKGEYVKTPPEKPPALEMFKQGHQQFYDDTRFCARFVWPPSMYLLIRKAHIPGIIRGMEEGLGNTEILTYAFNYLTLTGDFESAEKLVPLVPGHWFVQSPMLAQVCGAVLTMRGRLDEAMDYFEKARDLDQEDPEALFNLGKMYLITGKHQRAREAFQKALESPLLEDGVRSGIDFFMKSMEANQEKDIRLSLCMIARDEADALPRALASVAGLVDEMVVVDTGSADNTKEIAREMGALVFEHPWGDDFSAPRNLAMEKATGDYVFFLDADERLSPFHRINLLFLKALLSKQSRVAYELPVGRTDVTTDWLIISALPDNFIPQTSAIRIFPRIPEIRFEGRVVESVASSLAALKINVKSIPPGQLNVIHDEYGREFRVMRKEKAYDATENPSLSVVTNAVQDFSSIGHEEKSLHWLRILNQLHPVESDNWRLILRLALMMEDTDPEFARKNYEDLLEKGHDSPPVLNAYASYLLKNSDFEALAALKFETDDQSFENSHEEKSFLTHKALACLGGQDVDGAVELLQVVLDKDPGFLLAQASRFFTLSALGVVHGALSCLEDLGYLIKGDKEAAFDQGMDFMAKVETVASALEKTGHMEERFLLLNGAVCLVSGQEGT